MDLVNFQVGAKTIALPILNILLTERYDSDLTEIPNENPSFIGIKDFMDLPVPVFDLGMILNGSSTTAANNTLIDIICEHQNEISLWLEDLDQNKSIVSPEKLQFSKWFAHFNCDNEDLMTLLERVTNLTIELYTQYKNKESDTSNWSRVKLSTISHTRRLLEAAIEQVDVGYKPIIVFTTTDGRQPHVGLLVDKVEDSIHVQESDIKSLDAVTSIGFKLNSQVKAMMKGLIQLESKHSLIIEPSSLFTEELELEALIDT